MCCCMIETSSVPTRKSSGIFGKCSETFVKPSEQFWEIFGKWSEIFGKSSKTSKLVCLYNKQNITCLLVDMNFIFSCSLEDKIHIHAQSCNILYVMSTGRTWELVFPVKIFFRSQKSVKIS